MTRKAFSAAIMAAVLVSGSAFAQSQSTAKNNVPLQGESQIFFRADKLVGRSAQTPVGQDLGKIQDIAFNPEKGVYGIVKNQDDKLVPLPWSLVTAVTEKAVVFNTSAQAMATAPSFTDKEWSKMNQPQFTQKLDSHFQQAMGGSSSSQTQGSSSGSGASSQQQPQASSETPEASSESSSAATNSAPAQPSSGSDTNSASQ